MCAAGYGTVKGRSQSREKTVGAFAVEWQAFDSVPAARHAPAGDDDTNDERS
ncbi:hypothetical protein SBA5_220097 [Candidatus Sulfotelmatomonas gaucii]|uniref:Uncharacterized protein n=1 Tax=Candidatus Sulfuritelmatomonas gaucii TaxID=2043161 RepID=A0A2N9L7P2_9BACT|nr:hypothetical protein SBA5_220097 [Candidatus Sulfotelmatomonas gaucii]